MDPEHFKQLFLKGFESHAMESEYSGVYHDIFERKRKVYVHSQDRLALTESRLLSYILQDTKVFDEYGSCVEPPLSLKYLSQKNMLNAESEDFQRYMLFGSLPHILVRNSSKEKYLTYNILLQELGSHPNVTGLYGRKLELSDFGTRQSPKNYDHDGDVALVRKYLIEHRDLVGVPGGKCVQMSPEQVWRLGPHAMGYGLAGIELRRLVGRVKVRSKKGIGPNYKGFLEEVFSDKRVKQEYKQPYIRDASLYHNKEYRLKILREILEVSGKSLDRLVCLDFFSTKLSNGKTPGGMPRYYQRRDNLSTRQEILEHIVNDLGDEV
ncbi:MAG: hypothetical protein AABX52_03905 [Nanoarchaeota archaeon]